MTSLNIQSSQLVGYKAKAFEARNLAYFFLIVFGLQALKYGLLFSGILKLPSGEGLSALSAGPGVILLTLGAWGPIIAAFVVTAITEGKSGIGALWRRFWKSERNRGFADGARPAGSRRPLVFAMNFVALEATGSAGSAPARSQ